MSVCGLCAWLDSRLFKMPQIFLNKLDELCVGRVESVVDDRDVEQARLVVDCNIRAHTRARICIPNDMSVRAWCRRFCRLSSLSV